MLWNKKNTATGKVAKPGIKKHEFERDGRRKKHVILAGGLSGC